MNTDILMFEGEKIDLKLIKERHKKYDMFPTPWGKNDFMVLNISYRLFNGTNASITNGRS